MVALFTTMPRVITNFATLLCSIARKYTGIQIYRPGAATDLFPEPTRQISESSSFALRSNRRKNRQNVDTLAICDSPNIPRRTESNLTSAVWAKRAPPVQTVTKNPCTISTGSMLRLLPLVGSGALANVSCHPRRRSISSKMRNPPQAVYRLSVKRQAKPAELTTVLFTSKS